MVASPRKKPIISLSTWGPRGTAGLVEEWESRRSVRDEDQLSRRHSTVAPRNSTGTADTEDSKA